MGASLFIPKEIAQGESRVAATPETVKEFLKAKLSVMVESGAGEAAGISDDAYKQAGAAIVSQKAYDQADIVVSVTVPSMHPKTKKMQLEMMKKGSIWISSFLADDDLLSRAEKQKLTLFSLTLVPRITRAQKMDVLSSQSNIAGYKAVLLAATHLGKIFPLMMTAAGTMQPARVVVLGAGVAGLQAIATAKRLGAQVEASDIRAAVKEQVESLGASFIDVPIKEETEDEKGYAKGPSKKFLEKQAHIVSQRIKQADVVITTALVTGKKAPILIPEELVKEMKQGSVIVDMAAIQGGNCECTESGKTVQKHGVTIIGQTNLPSTVATHASETYAKNIQHFILGMIKDETISIPKDDEVYKDTLLMEKGVKKK